MTESRVHRKDRGEQSEDCDHEPIDLLQMGFVVEAVIDCGNSGSPHQYHNAQIVKLVTE